MDKSQIIKKLSDAGIVKLRKGETVADAIRYADGEINFRKGHIVGKDRNETIALNNKEAFSKTFTRPEYNESELISQDINEIPKDILNGLEDFRENSNLIGVLQPCQYCGTAMRCDEEGQYEIFNCKDSDCSNSAIWQNCM